MDTLKQFSELLSNEPNVNEDFKIGVQGNILKDKVNEEKNITMCKKITEEYERGLFSNYRLTKLMVLKKKGGRRIKLSENYALYLLLSDKLAEYGISLLNDQFETDGLTFRSIRLSENFPIENEPIIEQLYGYKNINVNIQLREVEEFASAFEYNVDTGKCELQKHRYGIITHRLPYDSMKSMLEDIKELGYEKLFK